MNCFKVKRATSAAGFQRLVDRWTLPNVTALTNQHGNIDKTMNFLFETKLWSVEYHLLCKHVVRYQ